MYDYIGVSLIAGSSHCLANDTPTVLQAALFSKRQDEICLLLTTVFGSVEAYNGKFDLVLPAAL